MLKEESLQFLQKCVEKINKATPEEIEIMKKAYQKNMECDMYCHSCDWEELITGKDGLYSHRCRLKLGE